MSSSFQSFFDDCCEMTMDYTDTIPISDFKKEYRDYCKKYKVQRESDKSVKKTLDFEGVSDTHDGKRRLYSGLKLKKTAKI